MKIKSYINAINEINRAIVRYQKLIKIDNSKIIRPILAILFKNNLIDNYIFIKDNKIVVYLKYYKSIKILKKIQLLSKPSNHIYLKNRDLFGKKYMFSFMILTTSQGIMDSEEAKKRKIGGKSLALIHF